MNLTVFSNHRQSLSSQAVDEADGTLVPSGVPSAPPTTPIFNDEGELTDVPAFDRARPSRFADPPGGKGASP